ncbi:MAG: hypothetical protein JO020_34120 [Chloroflexi bacterium]|nr:hypothetical protein [Chloroflexota bacterium]
MAVSLPTASAHTATAPLALDSSLVAPNHRYVVFIAGINNASAPGSEEAVHIFDRFKDLAESSLGNTTRFLYFSYCGTGVCPGGSWEKLADGNPDFGHPRYTQEATHENLGEQEVVLDAMINAIGSVDSNAVIDLVGYSLGGPVAYWWASSRQSSRVHRIVTLDSPLGGVESDALNTYGGVMLFGPVSQQLADPDSISLWLGAADRFDITAVENFYDPIINDQALNTFWGPVGRGLSVLRDAPPVDVRVPDSVLQLGGDVLTGTICPQEGLFSSDAILSNAGSYILQNHGTVLGLYSCTDAYAGSDSLLTRAAVSLSRDGPHWAALHPPQQAGNALLAAFPGVALVPPADLAPFANASVQIGVGIDTKSPGGAGYSVDYSKDGGTATVSGSLGQAKFTQDTAMAQPGCAATAQYCPQYGLGGRQSGPTGEIFRGIAIRGNPSLVSHVICCADPNLWQFEWYDRGADTSYSVQLSNMFDPQLEKSLGSQNADKVRYFAGLAAQFVPAGGRTTPIVLDVAAAGQQALGAFPQPVILPVQDLRPFASMSIEAVSVSTSIGPPSANAPAPRYSVSYRSPLGVASISGEPGDAGYQRALKGAFGCHSTDDYCVWRIFAGYQVERFATLSVNGTPAAVTHAFSTPPDWSIAWYDAQADLTYDIYLTATVDAAMGASGPTPANLGEAQYLAGLAEQFVRLDQIR